MSKLDLNLILLLLHCKVLLFTKCISSGKCLKEKKIRTFNSQFALHCWQKQQHQKSRSEKNLLSNLQPRIKFHSMRGNYRLSICRAIIWEWELIWNEWQNPIHETHRDFILIFYEPLKCLWSSRTTTRAPVSATKTMLQAGRERFLEGFLLLPTKCHLHSSLFPLYPLQMVLTKTSCSTLNMHRVASS